jgi:threonine dehydrogenase-like Zn-dependent dehydrogenase
VFGCGAIGLGVIAGAKFRGGRVIAIDVDDAKLGLAKACGAEHAINSQREPLHERLLDLTGGLGPRVVVEAVGLPATYQAAIEEVCFAGRLVCLGYAKAPIALDTKLFVLKELDVMGSRNAMPADFADVVHMLEAGGFPTERVVSHRVGLDGAAAALKQWSDSPATVTKIHVSLDA